MLVNLHVKNLALIEEADINPETGLNILTGETGAGKSILIGSINVALGGKVNPDFIRKGADYGLCELTFKVESQEKINLLKQLEIEELEEGIVIISRKILPNRSVIKVNGETKTISQVKEIASHLIDIHGQHEHHSLLYKSNYLSIIDRYCGDAIIEDKEVLRDLFEKYQNINKELKDFDMDSEQLNREMSYLEFEINEIEESCLKENEDIELESKFKKINNSRKIIENIKAAYECLSEKDDSVSDLIGRAYKEVQAVKDFDSDLDNIYSQLCDVEDIINGLNSDLSNYISNSQYDIQEFIEIEERLTFINHLKQKYGNTIFEIINYCEEQRVKLEKLKNYDENRNLLINQKNQLESKIYKICDNLTKIRKQYANKLSDDIINALTELNFIDVRFEIQLSQKSSFDCEGMDEIDILISTNPGEDLKPLAKVASGGELSRIMLAIKTVLADKDDIGCLIFDEIDTGISGRTAQMVSVKLNEISRMHQVICITHLPQIASMADEHFLIEKNVFENSTKTSIERLSYEESINELARLLGGVSITENVINNAKEMKELAFKSKNTII